MKSTRVYTEILSVFLFIMVMIISCKKKEERIQESSQGSENESIIRVIDSAKKTIGESSRPMGRLMEYDSINIGNQSWMATNLNTVVFRNGDSIQYARTKSEWEQAGREGKPAWCYYGDDEENDKVHGKLYNWFAVSDTRGLAPVGWKIPTEKDWQQFIQYFGGLNVISTELMSKAGWKYQNGTNKSGFNAFPSGGCFSNSKFDNFLTDAYYWCSSLNQKETDDNRAICFVLNYDLSMLISFSKSYGLSVRCLKE